jgi:hypothetical protein
LPHTPTWKDKFQRVVEETDKTKLKDSVLEAEGAMFCRLQELEGSADHHEERAEMHAATEKLLEIKRDKLGFPSWK